MPEAAVQAMDRYAHRNPKSLERWQWAAKVLPGGNTRSVLYFSPFPLCMEGGEGSFLVDADGHMYVDLAGEYTAGIYGHSNGVIQAALIKSLKNGISLASQTKAESQLASVICERFNSIELIRFTNSGSEANLMAITTAIACTGRKQILVFAESYHGGLLSFGAGLTSSINVPYDFIVAPYNDTSAARSIVREHRDTLAAILAEPMLGAGGCIPGDPEFLRTLQDEAWGAGALLILDEIQTSRLSSGGRQKLLGICPDMTTLGKYFGGGLSFGAFGGRRDLMERFDPCRPGSLNHGGTFNNNVLSMSAGFAGLSQVLTPDALDALNRRGEELMTSLNGLFVRIGLDLHVCGLGSIMNFHFRGDERRRADAIRILFFDLLDRGFYIAPRGLIALSLAVTAQQLSDFLRAVEEIVKQRHDLFCSR